MAYPLPQSFAPALIIGFLLLLSASHASSSRLTSLITPWQCPNHPAGRLSHPGIGHETSPLPGYIGIAASSLHNKSDSSLSPPVAVSWAYTPRCVAGSNPPTDKSNGGTTPRVHCLFTSSDFRAGHGTSLISTTSVAAHLVGVGAFIDSPPSPAQRRMLSIGPPYVIADVAGKGKGVLATRRIRRGEIIMVDVPAVMVGTAFLADVRPHHRRRVLKQAIGQLPDELKARVMALGRLEGEYEVDSILGVNSNSVVIEVGGDEGELHVGLFTEAARINHSCRPNAYYRFSPRRLTMEVVAYHAIEAGEEIVMSYVPLDTARSERRQFLKETWGFDCTCSLCHGSELDITNSETWRRRMTDLRGSVLHARREGYFQDAINISKDWLHFSELEMVPPLLAEYHDTLAELYRLKGDLINATRYGRMALDGWVRLGSVEDDQLEKARVFLKDLS